MELVVVVVSDPPDGAGRIAQQTARRREDARIIVEHFLPRVFVTRRAATHPVCSPDQGFVVGAWGPGDRVPGVRELAADLGVNPNTVQRALSELERSGLARSERTTGRFVTTDEGRIDALRLELAREAADDFVRRARGLQMRQDQARALLDERWQTHGDEHDIPPEPRTDARPERAAPDGHAPAART